MGLRCIRLVAALVVVAIAASVAGETASADPVQTIGNTGPLRLRYPLRVALGPTGLIYVLDMGNTSSSPLKMWVYSPSGRLQRSWRIATGSGPIPNMAVDAAGNAYVVASTTVDNANLEYTIVKYSPTGRLLTARWGAVTVDSRVDYPGLYADWKGNILVAVDGRIDTFDGAGQLVTSRRYAAPGDNKNRISGLAVTTSGTVYVADRKGIARLDSSGKLASRIVPAGDRAGQVSWATLIAGPQDTLYALREQRIQRFAPDGEFLGAVGSDRHATWISAAVSADGSIYVPQFRLDRQGAVLKLAPITTVDATPPSITVDSISSGSIKAGAGKHSRGLLPRFTYTLSEDASFRIVLKSLAKTQNRRHRDFGHYLHRATLDNGVTAAGTHTFVIDRPGWGREPGSYQLILVARDGAGNESVPARVKFSVARR